MKINYRLLFLGKSSPEIERIKYELSHYGYIIQAIPLPLKGLSHEWDKTFGLIFLTPNSNLEELVDFCRKLHKKILNQIPLIALSDNTDEPELDYFFKNGGFDYIHTSTPSKLILHRTKIAIRMHHAKMLNSALLNAASEGICFINKEFIITNANEMLEMILSLKNHSIIGKKCYDVFSFADCKTENCPLSRSISGNLCTKIKHKEFIRIKDRKRYYSLSISPLYNPEGEIDGIIKAFTDNSEKYDIKEMLHLKSIIIDNSLTGANLTLPDTTIMFVNNQCLKMWGYEFKEEVLGKKTAIFFNKPEQGKDIFKILEKKNYWQGEFEGRRKDGTVFHVYTIVKKILKNNGSLLGYLASNIDITVYKESITALKKSEARFKELFNKALSGLTIYTPVEDGTNFIINNINKSGETLSNTCSKDIIGKLVTDKFPNIKKFGLFKVLQDVWKTGVPVKLPISYYKDENCEGWFENYVFKLSSNEIATLYTDMTEIKNGEIAITKAINTQKELSGKLRKNLIETVRALSNTVEYRDYYTVGHSKNVAEIACKIAKELNLSKENILAIRIAGELHDIGKIAIPLSILTKKGKLTDDEYELIKTHPTVGYELTKNIGFSFPISRIILEHHERLDGSGYPNGKFEDEILLESKILAVADVVETMSLPRPYRDALGVKAALDEIKENSGIKYDKIIVNACIKIFNNKNVMEDSYFIYHGA